ncbi:MAG: hypothetical protein ACOVQ4_00070 [Flectobacillus sp.]
MKNGISFLGKIMIMFLIYLGFKNNKFSPDELFQFPALVGFLVVVVVFLITTKVKKQR